MKKYLHTFLAFNWKCMTGSGIYSCLSAGCHKTLIVFITFLLATASGILYGQHCPINSGVCAEVCENEQVFLHGNETGVFPSGDYSLNSTQISKPAVTIAINYQCVFETPEFALGATSIRRQGASAVTYTAVSGNAQTITKSLINRHFASLLFCILFIIIASAHIPKSKRCCVNYNMTFIHYQ